MKRIGCIVATFALLLAGCEKPTQVQLADETDLEVEAIAESDSVASAPVDTLALLPREQVNYPGLISIASVRFDNGVTTETVVGAKVALEDRTRWFFDRLGRKRFYGYFLGTVSVNGIPLLRRVRAVGNDSAGFEYVGLVPYTPRLGYRFIGTGSVGGVRAFDESVTAPDDLVVQSPVGGTQVRRGNPLDLRWTPQGNPLTVIVSAVRTVQGERRVIPVLSITPKKNSGRAVLPRRILDALPRGTYVLTFAVANKDERRIQGYSGRVLVLASSICNVQINLL